MEHSIFGVEEDKGWVFKATKGSKFGFWPHASPGTVSTDLDDVLGMRPATPGQYLLRLALWDELVPGLTCFQGFTELDGQFSIVISQTWLVGRNSTWKEISTHLRSLGFLPVRSSPYDDPTRWYHPDQDLALFDVGQSNIFWSDGELFPIDIIPVKPEPSLRHVLRSTLGLP